MEPKCLLLLQQPVILRETAVMQIETVIALMLNTEAS
jgi:hypothetical protein